MLNSSIKTHGNVYRSTAVNILLEICQGLRVSGSLAVIVTPGL